MTDDALYAACLLSCGPHAIDTIGTSLAFNHYYNRIYAWYQQNVFPDAAYTWIQFYKGYLDWVGEDTLPHTSVLPRHLHTV